MQDEAAQAWPELWLRWKDGTAFFFATSFLPQEFAPGAAMVSCGVCRLMLLSPLHLEQLWSAVGCLCDSIPFWLEMFKLAS